MGEIEAAAAKWVSAKHTLQSIGHAGVEHQKARLAEYNARMALFWVAEALLPQVYAAPSSVEVLVLDGDREERIDALRFALRRYASAARAEAA